MKLLKTDIRKIGNTTYQNQKGEVNIICDLVTSNIEEILLREILIEIGNFKILESKDYTWENGDSGIEFVTNLPWEFYESII
jgi:hypothetical protein